MAKISKAIKTKYNYQIFKTMKNKKYPFLFFLIVLLSTGIGWAQNEKITLHLDNVSLEHVLSKIEEKTAYSFQYSKQVIDVRQKRTIHVDKQTIHNVLETLLKGTSIQYQIKNRQIILSAKKTVKTNTKMLKGIIKDRKTGEPIIGASIAVEKESIGAISDINGNFAINVSADKKIVVSYIGYESQVLDVLDKSFLEIYLSEDIKLIDEVVVVGYGSVSKKNLTTAIAQVKTDKISQAGTSHVNQLLMGRAAGLQATVNSMRPDGKVNISIRGGGNPIYVIDGIVMPNNALSGNCGQVGLPNNIDRNGIANLNPADVESVEILKDASAAIYGIGADNGVILITTKKGKEGAPNIVYDGSYSFVRNYPYLDVLNSKEYMELANVFNKENYLYNNKQYPYGTTPYDGKWKPQFTEADMQNATDTDWKDLVLRNGFLTKHNLTISGGHSKFKYYLGGSYLKQQGTVSRSGMTKYSVHGNLGLDLFPFLNLTSVFNANQNTYDNGIIGTDTGNQGDVAPSVLTSALLYPSYLPVKQDDGSYTIFRNIPNPKAMEDIVDYSKENGYSLNFSINAKLYKDILVFKGVYGMNQENVRRSTFIPSDVYFARMYKSRGNIYSQRRQTQTLEAMLSFSKYMFNFVQVDAMAGMGKYLESNEGYGISYEDTHDMINEHDISSAKGKIYPTSHTLKNEKRSQFFKLSFDVLDRYVISATLRRDGTDKFFPGKKYALFPSVSAAWKISNEKFLKDVFWINLLKLRASYGKTGQDNLGSSLYGVYEPSGFKVGFNDNGLFYVPCVSMGTNYPDVSWQKTIMKNIGLDFYLFKNRVSGSIDVFRNDVTSLLGYASTSPLAIYPTRPINGGHFYRQGWEIMLDTKNMVGDFNWNTQLTFSKTNSFWKERMPNYDYRSYQKRNKEPMNAYYYYKMTGIINADRSNMPESQKTLQAEAQLPGCPIIDDKNNDGKIDENDIYLKDNTPDIYIGFGNTFTYKNWEFSFFMYGQFGILKSNIAYRAALPGPLAVDYPENTNKYAYLLWNSQTNPNGTRPGLAVDRMGALPGGAGVNIDMENASFVRMRNITLSYNFRDKILGKLKKYVKGIKVYADVQNPFVISKFKGFDPEIYTGGGGANNASRGEYPQARTFTLGTNIVF